MSTATDKIDFDSIHTAKKQNHLQKIMETTCVEILKMPNSNPVLTACPICDTEDVEFYVEKFGFRLDRCSECGHLFCNPYPEVSQLTAYYQSSMKEFENEFFRDSFEKRLPIFEHRIKVIEQYIKRGRILDVGSAVGIFIEALKRGKAEFEVESCDPSAEACMYLKNRFPQLIVHQMMLEDLNVSDKFDVVTMWDTLEHILDPYEIGEAVRGLLKPGGYWFFSTPYIDGFEWQIAQREHVQILPPGHINLFTLKGIQTLLDRTGFSLVNHFTPNGLLDVSYVKKLLKGDQADLFRERLGVFLGSQFETNDSFCDLFADLISNKGLAGNILAVARVK